MKYLLTFLIFGFLSSCSTRTCKPNENITNDQRPTPVAGETTLNPTTTMTNQIKKIKVYKPDGSVQCEQGSGTSAAEMQKQLGDIKVYSSDKKSDGLIRIQVCGQPTGYCNVYEISEADLVKAEKNGFKKWKNN